MYKLHALDLFFLMILSNCWSILTSRQATGAGTKCLSVPRALFLTPWWAGSDEQVDVLTFWRFLSPSLPTARDGGWRKSGPPMRFTSVILGRCSNNQNGNLRWIFPLGAGPPPPLMDIVSRHFFTPLFFFCNWILHIWNGFYTSKIPLLSPLIIGSELTFISSSGRWLPTI